MNKKLFKGTRIFVIHEDVEVFAYTYDKAKDMIEDDDDDVKVTEERQGDYELVGHLIEIKE